MDYLDLGSYSDPLYVEAIKDGEIIRVPERVAIEEDLFILRKLGAPAVPNIPMNLPVIKRDSPKNALISDWKQGKFGMKKNNVLQDLVPNFHWQIGSNRKKRNLTRLRVAQMIGASESDVKMLELGELPSDDFVLISRIEQLFGINLRKHNIPSPAVNLAELQKRAEQKQKEIPTPAKTENAGFSGSDIEILDD